MKKAFDQTVRDLKREVNKKVLKVPGIEQKVLDATCNEPWGPHGSHLADIAQATRNFHEYQMIMSVLWKRVNDTGKNWRHVYKGLIVLEYLVAHGSERVIDEIREHAYQISTLSNFQYIDSSGRDQGSNVRKKSQSLVALVNDKDRIQEVRQKAYANKDKFHTSAGGMHKSSSYSSMGGGSGDRYDDDRYGSHRGYRSDGYGRDRDWNNRDEDGYGTGGDSYSREGDRYNRQPSDEHYGREGYRDDDRETGSRHRNSDAERNRSGDEDDRYSSRSGRGRRDGYSPDERGIEQKISSHHSAPPSYEEAVSDVQPHARDERNEGNVRGSLHKGSSPIVSTIQSQSPTIASVTAAAPMNKEISEFDEFDPRGAFSAAPTSSAYAEKSSLEPVLGLTSDALALVPVSFPTATSDADPFAAPGLEAPFETQSTTPTALSQATNDPFGDSPFRAIPSQGSVNSHLQSSAPPVVMPTAVGEGSGGGPHPPQAMAASIDDFGFGESFQTITYTPLPVQTHTNLGFQPSEQTIQPPPSAQPPPEPYVEPMTRLQQPPSAFLPPQIQQPFPYTPSLSQVSSQPFMQPNVLQSQPYLQQPQSQACVQSQTQMQPQQSSVSLPNVLTQSAPSVATSKSQPQKDKFETKSAVWADLSPGLVNLNISGSKINPLADIGIDFDSINRVEKRKEKEREKSAASSTIAMGKAMGAGSGMGRAGATGLALPPRPMMGAGMGMGNGVGAGMSGYGFGMNQPMGMGAGAGSHVQPGMGMPPSGPGMGPYNPAMGMGGYGMPNLYGGGYR